MPETETETPEPTVLLTGISGATYKVPADVVIAATLSANGASIRDPKGRIKAIFDYGQYIYMKNITVQESPLECRRLGYQAKGYLILHSYLGGEEIAVPASAARTRTTRPEFLDNPTRIDVYPGDPMIRLHDKTTFKTVTVRETAEEIDALLSKTPDTRDKADTDAGAKAQDLFRALTNASAATASAHSAYLKAKAEFVAAAEALVAAAKALDDLQL